MKRHDDSQRSGRTEKQLTAPADRPVRESAHAVAFTTDVAIRGAGSVHRRTGMRTARALPGGSGRPGSPPAIPPALTAIQTRCFAHHHPMVAHHLLCRCQAGADVRRADGSIPGPHVPLSTLHPRPCPPLRVAAHDSGPPWVASPSTYDSFVHHDSAGFCRRTGGAHDTQRTARARSVNPLSHTPRASPIRLRLAVRVAGLRVARER